MKLWLWWMLVSSCLSKIIVRQEDDTTTDYPSFNGLPGIHRMTLSDTPEYQWLLTPGYINNNCQLDWGSIAKFPSDSKLNHSALAIVATKDCQDYMYPINNFSKLEQQVAELGYPPIATVLWCDVVGNRDVLGSPYSSIYNEQDSFVPKRNITYQIVEDSKFSTKIINSRMIPRWVQVIDDDNRWHTYVTSMVTYSWLITFKALNFIVLLAQFILCGFVVARTKGKSLLQIGMLLVGVLHLGGEMVISLANFSPNVARIYLTVILILEGVINSLVNLSWCSIIWRLRTCVKIVRFRFSILLECGFVSAALVLQLILIIFASEWIGNQEQWYEGLLWLVLIIITVIPVLMIIWFFLHALKFCPIFHSTAKLINAQWLTMFLLLTRISFIISLVSSYLLMLQSYTPTQWTAFKITNSIAVIVYQVMIVLTVIKIQNIRQVQHTWTPDQLGYTVSPTGALIFDSHSNPIPTSQCHSKEAPLPTTTTCPQSQSPTLQDRPSQATMNPATHPRFDTDLFVSECPIPRSPLLLTPYHPTDPTSSPLPPHPPTALNLQAHPSYPSLILGPLPSPPPPSQPLSHQSSHSSLDSSSHSPL